jgi:hypothetical protein
VTLVAGKHVLQLFLYRTVVVQQFLTELLPFLTVAVAVESCLADLTVADDEAAEAFLVLASLAAASAAADVAF